jgi:hypothetical protein
MPAHLSTAIAETIDTANVADYGVLDTLDGTKRYIIALTEQVQLLSNRLDALEQNSGTIKQ